MSSMSGRRLLLLRRSCSTWRCGHGVLSQKTRLYTTIPAARTQESHLNSGSKTSGNDMPHQMPSVVRVPRVLFFGGDVVSITALEALYQRMQCIVRNALQLPLRASGGIAGSTAGMSSSCTIDRGQDWRAKQLVRDHLTVICPALPPSYTPATAALKFKRQYPVARFCAENDIPVVPVDHPKSLAKSILISEMLDRHCHYRSPASAHPQHAASVAKSDAPTWATCGRPLEDFDLAVVVSFRYFIPDRLLRVMPPTINMHPSLLPKYRGASPIFSTLMRNEEVGGVSIIQMKEKQPVMDSGNILWQCEVPVQRDTDIRTYFPLVTQIGAAGLCDLIFGERQIASNTSSASSSGYPSTTSADNISGTVSHTSSTSTAIHRVPPRMPLFRSRSSSVMPGMRTRTPCPPLTKEWTIPCRAPPQLTQPVVRQAAHTHHQCILGQLLNNERLHGRGMTAMPEITTTMKCSEIFPFSVLNPSCDWPDSFTYSWRFAAPQDYERYSHFSLDPNHAPLLPKDAAVLGFSRYSDYEAYGVWRSFVGGQYFQPAVSATLDKGNTPVRNQLVRRALRRLVRAQESAERKKKKNKDYAVKASKHHEARSHGFTANQESSIKGDAAKGCASHPGHLSLKESVITAEMLAEAQAGLRLSCTFLRAVHPDMVPESVRRELREVEEGAVRFYRPPPQIFSSVAHKVATCASTALMLMKTETRMAASAAAMYTSAGGFTVANTEQVSITLADVGDEDADDAADLEEAPLTYVPEVIHAAPPHAANAPATSRLHIPPGTGYFPQSHEGLGAIKCREGWFIWREAHLKSSARPQPASLLRKGLAMKTGLLYTGVFSEYS